MSETQLTSSKGRLEKDLQSPESAMLLEKAKETYPHLVAFYEYVRKITFALKTKLDLDVLNEKVYKDFVFLCQHDLLFFLTVTGRYDEILRLFEDKELTALLIASMENEGGQAKNQQDMLPLLLKKEVLTPQDMHEFHAFQKAQEYFNWAHPDPNLSHMEKLQHYERELQRITLEFHRRRMQIYSDSCDSKLVRVNNLLKELKKDKTVDTEVIRKVEEMNENYVNQIQEIKLMQVRNPDGSLNEMLTEQNQQKELQTLTTGFTQGVYDVLGKEAPKNPKIIKFIQEDIKEDKKTSEQIKAVERAFTQQVQKISPHIENALKIVKAENERNLSKVIQAVEALPKEQLNQAQKNALGESLKQLKKCQQDIKNAKDSGSILKLEQQCAGEVKKIENIMKPVLTEEAFNQFRKDTESLNKVASPSQSEEVPGDQTQLTQSSNVENVTPGTQEPTEVTNQARVLSGSAVPLTPGATQLAGRSPAMQPEDQRQMRLSLQMAREIGMFAPEAPEVPQGLDPNQSTFNDSLDRILRKIEIAREKKPFNGIEQAIVDKIEEQIKVIKAHASYHDVPSEQITSLSNELENLAENCERLEDIKEELDPILEFVTPSPQEQTSLNM